MRLRLIPSLVILLTVILIIAALTLYYNFNRTVEGETELHLYNWADNLLLEISANPGFFKKKPSSFIFSATGNEFTSSGVLVQFMDKDGKLLARSPNLKQNSLPFTKGDDDILKDVELSDGTKLKIYQRAIETEGQDLGFVVVGISTSQMAHNLENLRNLLVVVIFCTAVFLGISINALVLSDVLRNQRKFLSFVSHELRTPLSVISGNTELALRKKLTTQEYEQALSVIKEEAEWMNRLVSNLLMVFRSQAGAEKLNQTRFNLGELIAEAASSLKKRYPERNIILNLPEEAEIKADPDRIKQVVNNLLENAARNTAADGRIAVKLISEPKQFVLEVSDNGKGIDKDLQKRIFNAFYRIEQKKEGVGLGLAISRWVVEAHGGKIRVDSEPGRGATFTVYLPTGKMG